MNCHANGDRKQMRAMADTTYGYYYYLYNDESNYRSLLNIMFALSVHIAVASSANLSAGLE